MDPVPPTRWSDARLSALREWNGSSLDHYARLVGRLLGVPTAMVTVLGTDHQHFAGMIGIAEPFARTRATPLSHSFCERVVDEGVPVVVPDARRDPRFSGNPAIEDLNVVAYLAVPLAGPGGSVIGSLCAATGQPREWRDEDLEALADVATACSSELALRLEVAEECRALAQAIFEASDLAMIFVDTSGSVLLSNELAETLTTAAGFDLRHPPYVGDRVCGPDGSTPVPPEEQTITRALHGFRGDGEVRWIGEPGRQRAVMTSAQSVVHGNGEPWGTMLIGHDVTRLLRSVQVRNAFPQAVSHELRTPLASIVGNVEALRAGLDTDDPPSPEHSEHLEHVERIHQSALVLDRHISSLLEAGAISRATHLELAPVDVTGLVRRVVAASTELADRAEVQLLCQGGTAEWATLDGDEVERIVTHLLANAIGYSPPGATVVAVVEGTPDDVSVVVTDAGVGMSEEEVDQAPEPFWRSRAPHNARRPGLGVGLAVVRDLVERHDGQLRITSSPGAGTSVQVTFNRLFTDGCF